MASGENLPVEQYNYEPQSLCMCVTCGKAVGYQRSDAENHYKMTGHKSFLDLYSQRYWDLIEGNFAPYFNTMDSNFNKYGSTKKSQDPSIQLQRQRFYMYYTEKLTQAEEDAAKLISFQKENLTSAEDKLEQLRLAVSKAEEEVRLAHRKYEEVVTQADKLDSEIKKERELNRRLRKEQKSWNERVKEAEAKLQAKEARKEEARKKEAWKQQVSALKEQIEDIKYHLKARKAAASTSDETRQELQHGQIVIGKVASPTYKSKKSGRKKK